MKKSNLDFVKSFRKLIDKDLNKAFAGKSPGEVEVFKHAFYYDLFGQFATPFNDYNEKFLEKTEEYRQLAREKLRMGQDEFRDTFCTYGSYSATVSYTHLTLPTIRHRCRSRWSPYH